MMARGRAALLRNLRLRLITYPFSRGTLFRGRLTQIHICNQSPEKSSSSPPNPLGPLAAPPALINRKWFIRAYSLKQGVISEL